MKLSTSSYPATVSLNITFMAVDWLSKAYYKQKIANSQQRKAKYAQKIVERRQRLISCAKKHKKQVIFA